MKPLLVVPKAAKPIEAMCWTPDQKGRQRGGWPKTKAWAAAKTWPVSAVDLTLYIGVTPQTVRPGDWVLRMPDGRFVRVSHYDFNLLYDLVRP